MTNTTLAFTFVGQLDIEDLAKAAGVMLEVVDDLECHKVEIRHEGGDPA